MPDKVIDVRPQATLINEAPPGDPPAPASPSATDQAGASRPEPVGVQGVGRGRFGGQQLPIVLTSQTGPRLRGADVHDMNVRADAIAWYFVLTDVPQPSRFLTKGECRECAWSCHSILAQDDTSVGSCRQQLSEHVMRHVFGA